MASCVLGQERKQLRNVSTGSNHWLPFFVVLFFVFFGVICKALLPNLRSEFNSFTSYVFLLALWFKKALPFISFFSFYKFIYFWLSLLGREGATLCCSVWASHCSGFSCGTQVLGARASVVVACRLSSCGTWALEGRLSSCGAWA